MKRRLLLVTAWFLSLSGVASAHRLDEYLQATLLTVGQDRVQGSMRLIPGVAVSAGVVAEIDRNGDGVLSVGERQAYAERVLRDWTVSIDGRPVTPRLVSMSFPGIGEMREGLGEIHLEWAADLPAGGHTRRLVLENMRRDANTAYMVNALVPQDRTIEITGQQRNALQTLYELEYVRTDVAAAPAHWWAQAGGAGFVSLFRLGVRHIAEGTDHLLFLLALLLPAPLLAVGGRWSGVAGLRKSLMRILKIVTAFTVGHSITLALAATGVVSIPGRPVEVLIAVSILISAVHALRPLFPGREAWVAAFFGLIHGLAFATTLSELGLGHWERMVGILAFNLGIETMQMLVVAATLPSLLLLSRTRAYPVFRVGGAVFAGVAAAGWIAERTLGLHGPVDGWVSAVARQAGWGAAMLFLVSAGSCWFGRTARVERGLDGCGYPA